MLPPSLVLPLLPSGAPYKFSGKCKKGGREERRGGCWKGRYSEKQSRRPLATSLLIIGRDWRRCRTSDPLSFLLSSHDWVNKKENGKQIQLDGARAGDF